ncbi:helix-turn-helix transcriptional regulator [Burkholderia contaminans]|uniref:helix-turn-helix domain-containing protein n=1 Tax=Burkholderia contaminans TaxID=488447 RepID=UPI0018DDF96F|nr:helix-turn-helix transcriptional regulator [Burkholderia contaminans]MBH9725141.1 helix-turn-helix transcriptional regulator [Burkholderia contaminans]
MAYSLTHSLAMKNVGERLRDLLLAHPNYGERGQSKLSRDTGVPQPTISRILRGGSVPELETLAALAIPFGVTCEWLLTERGPKFVAELYASQPHERVADTARALPPNAQKLISEIRRASEAGVSEEAFSAVMTLLRLMPAQQSSADDGDLPHLQP